jgi:hypothetical protein
MPLEKPSKYGDFRRRMASPAGQFLPLRAGFAG